MRQYVVSLLESGEERNVKVMIISSEQRLSQYSLPLWCCYRASHVFTGVCQWKKPGQARGGENVRVRLLCIYFILIVVLNVPSSAHVSVIKQSTSVHTAVNSVIKQPTSIHTAVNSQSSNSQRPLTMPLRLSNRQRLSRCCQYVHQTINVYSQCCHCVHQATNVHSQCHLSLIHI